LFPVFLHSFLLPHKNMKTNVALLSYVRFCSVFIASSTCRGINGTNNFRSASVFKDMVCNFLNQTDMGVDTDFFWGITTGEAPTALLKENNV
jgi:hypothetical protein